ncbi:MAG: helix-turn-helix transcriptional regulator [Burkholderiaceae bacterium]|nr:helix-turn-helix transcriptional regulator [Burkholderiaceae bacterium]
MDPAALPAPSAPATPDRYCRLEHGFLYASRRLHTVATVRPAGVLLLSACGRPFVLHVGPRRLEVQAAAVRPLVARDLHALGVALVSLNVHPTDAAFARFAALAGDGVLALPPQAFMPLRPSLVAFADGRLATRAQGQALAEALLDRCAGGLPEAPAADALRPALLAWLQQHPDGRLDQLAQALGISYHRMSHRFTQAMGLPFRHWMAFARAQRAARRFAAGATLTGIAHEAGFHDSAHLSHTWQRTYGLSPSFVRSGNSVQAIL